MKIPGSLAHVVFVVFAVMSASQTYAQDKANDQLSIQMVGTWDFVIENVNEVVYLRIGKVTARSNDEYVLDAAYGWPSRERPVQSAELIKTGNVTRLSFTARNGGKAEAVQSSDGSFVGTWNYKSYPTRAVKVVKLSDSEIRSTPLVEQASADVPKECAAFLGGWTGTWNNSGQVWLWVTSVDAKCNAKYAYDSTPYPRAFKDSVIKDGVLVATNSVGTNNFRFENGRLHDRWVGYNGNSDTLAFNRVDPGTDPAKAAATMIVGPAADVPASCAAFSGKWTGTWGYGIGQQWLWVASIDSKCGAKIAYLGNSDTPSDFQNVEIRDGVLEWLCNRSTGGTCRFSSKGDELWASYSNPSGGTNSAVFKKLR